MTDPDPSASPPAVRSRVSRRLADQWSALRRGERRPDPAPDPALAMAGTSNFTRAEVPYGIDLAAAWGWRLLVIAGGIYVLKIVVSTLSVLIIPLIIAVLLTALVEPVVSWLARHGLRRGLASLLVVLLTFVFVGGLLGFAGQQVASGADDLRASAIGGLNEIRDWLHTGPLHLSEKQLNDYFQQAEDGVKNAGTNHLFARAGEVGSVFADTVAGFFIVVLSTYFFLADGRQIWAFLVRLMPRAARERTDSSGRVAWISLTKFVHATCIVAATDALLIAAGAAILGVPFVLAIGVLVFLGAFVPILGAVVAGAVAVLVALVDQGFVQALIMLLVVVGVNQLESHGLQPFLMGRWVRLHPLGVIFAIGAGVIIAGVPGALVAVPFTAAANAVVQHLAGFSRIGGDPEKALAADYAEDGGRPPDQDELEARVRAEDDQRKTEEESARREGGEPFAGPEPQPGGALP